MELDDKTLADLKALYPEQSEQELLEAHERMDEYIRIALAVFEHARKDDDPEA